MTNDHITRTPANKRLAPPAVGKAPQPVAWQLLDSAPKNGTKILVCDAAAYPERVWVAWYKDGSWVSAYYQGVLLNLTHWCALPVSPCAEADALYATPAPAQAVATAGKREGMCNKEGVGFEYRARPEWCNGKARCETHWRPCDVAPAFYELRGFEVRAEADAIRAERTQGESDAAFVERVAQWGLFTSPDQDCARVIALARRGATRSTPDAGDVLTKARIAAAVSAERERLYAMLFEQAMTLPVKKRVEWIMPMDAVRRGRFLTATEELQNLADAVGTTIEQLRAGLDRANDRPTPQPAADEAQS